MHACTLASGSVGRMSRQSPWRSRVVTARPPSAAAAAPRRGPGGPSTRRSAALSGSRTSAAGAAARSTGSGGAPEPAQGRPWEPLQRAGTLVRVQVARPARSPPGAAWGWACPACGHRWVGSGAGPSRGGARSPRSRRSWCRPRGRCRRWTRRPATAHGHGPRLSRSPRARSSGSRGFARSARRLARRNSRIARR
jgi:hypothetical protein